MYCSVYYIKKIVLLPHKNRAVYSNAFHDNHTCEIEIIDFISGVEKSINHSILYKGILIIIFKVIFRV